MTIPQPDKQKIENLTPEQHHGCKGKYPSWETVTEEGRTLRWCYGCNRTWYMDTGKEGPFYGLSTPPQPDKHKSIFPKSVIIAAAKEGARMKRETIKKADALQPDKWEKEFYDKFVEKMQTTNWIADFIDDKPLTAEIIWGWFESKLKSQRQEFIKEIQETERAFGGCKKCYGKGYSTERVGATVVEPDFEGERGYILERAHVEIHPCTCDRGKQIKELFLLQPKRQELIKEIREWVRENKRSLHEGLPRFDGGIVDMIRFFVSVDDLLAFLEKEEK